MDINAASLAALFRNYVLDWQKGIAWRPTVDLSFLVTDFPSTTSSNFYAWLELIPGFREWVGSRVFNNVRSQNFEVTNTPFEASYAMEANKIADDQFGVYAPIIQMLGAAWPQLLQKIAIDTILNNDAIFDSVALFSDSHVYGANTIDNLVTDALSSTSFEAAFVARDAYLGSNNERIPGKYTHLVVGEKLRSTAFALVAAEHVSVSGGSTQENPNYKKAELVILPEFSGAYDDYWLLVDASGPIKAIARQIRKTPTPLMDTDPATVARTGQIDFMADGRAAARGTFPHLIYGGRL